MGFTDKQAYDATIKHGSFRSAGAALGYDHTALGIRAKRYAAANGLSLPKPTNQKVADLAGDKAVYDAVVKYGSVNEASRKLPLDKNLVTKRAKRYAAANGLSLPKPSNQHTRAKKDVVIPSELKPKTGGIQRYIITCAQNNTELDKPAFACIKKVANHKKAQLVVVPLFYKNVSAWHNNDAAWWPAEVLPYTVHGDIIINKEWMILGSLHIQTTAANPLEGLSGISKDKSAIIGHPQIELEHRPVPPGFPPIAHITTGSVSVPSYSDSKAGQLAQFHHSCGALYIETDGVNTFYRHLRYDKATDSILDLDTEYKSTTINNPKKVSLIDSVIFGDWHERFSPQTDYFCNFLTQYKPGFVLLHDAFDSFSVTHHHRGRPFMQLAKMKTGTDSFIDEMKSLVKSHNRLTTASPDSTIVYVDSNHCDEHIFRWLQENDWRIMGNSNASAYLKLAATYVDILQDVEQAWKYVTRGILQSPLKLMMEELGANTSNTVFLQKDESFMRHGIECGLHGHKGANGSKGTRGGFVKTQYKLFIGHGHSAGIKKNVYQVGTNGPMQAEYTGGPSSWSRTDGIIYTNGKRILFNNVNGVYTIEGGE